IWAALVLQIPAPLRHYPAPLHDALPISPAPPPGPKPAPPMAAPLIAWFAPSPPRNPPGPLLPPTPANDALPPLPLPPFTSMLKRSEEHTSELQSRGHLVCRLPLETKRRR